MHSVTALLMLATVSGFASSAMAQTPEFWSIAASRTADDHVAAFSESRVATSIDAGVSWRYIFRRSSVERFVSAVAWARDGSVLVADSHNDAPSVLHIIDTNGVDVALASLPGVIDVIMTSRSSIACWVRGQVFLSRDAGRSFVPLEFSPACEGCEGGLGSSSSFFLDSDGNVYVADIEISTCGSSDELLWAFYRTASPDGRQRRRALPIASGAISYEAATAPRPGGWVYLIDQGALHAARASTMRVLARTGFVALGSNGRDTVALFQTSLVRLVNGRAVPLARELPPSLRSATDAQLSVGAAGSVFLIAGGVTPFHFVPRVGFVPIRLPDP